MPVDRFPRPRFAAVACVSVGAFVLAQGIAYADPSPDDVRERIEELEQEFSSLNDEYNEAREDYSAAEARLEDVQEDLEETRDGLGELRDSVRRLAGAAYTGHDPSSPMYLIASSEPENLLARAADLGYLSNSQQAELEEYIEELDRLHALETEAADLEEQAAEDLDRAEEAREDGEAAIEEQQGLLDDLTAEEQAEAVPQSTSEGSEAAPAYTGSAAGSTAAVLDFAYAQIGKPYVWGGTGPDGYDCSGLTQAAWRQAGVSLPRVAADQFRAGSHVAWENLEPGDLLFFYDSSAPSHVGLYAGDGRMVHASNSSRPVMEVELGSHYRSSFVGAVRP